MLANKQRYIDTITAVVAFLQERTILSLIASVIKITFQKAIAEPKRGGAGMGIRYFGITG